MYRRNYIGVKDSRIDVRTGDLFWRTRTLNLDFWRKYYNYLIFEFSTTYYLHVQVKIKNKYVNFYLDVFLLKYLYYII